MAGSYNHITTEQGDLGSFEMFSDMIDHLGDAYETVEEMYGMIWFMAHMAPEAGALSPEDLVEQARQGHALGLELAKQNKNKAKRDYS